MSEECGKGRNESHLEGWGCFEEEMGRRIEFGGSVGFGKGI